jgi:hypothetical protein
MTPTPSHPTGYEIRVAGHLPPQWADWFEGLTISLEESGDTLLTGPVIDQAALHGLLKKVRDLGLSLVSVSPVEPEPPAMPGTHQAAQPDGESKGDTSELEATPR